MVGGCSPMDSSDERLKEVVTQVIPEFEPMAQAQGRNGMIGPVEIIEAQRQVVAGMNYFVKVRPDARACPSLAPYRASALFRGNRPRTAASAPLRGAPAVARRRLYLRKADSVPPVDPCCYRCTSARASTPTCASTTGSAASS